MRFVRRIGGAMAILFALTGCAVGSHATKSVLTLPSCNKILLELNHLSTSLNTKDRIPQATTGQMRFCRYRWDNGENKLVLISDITRPLAPVALLHALSQLKTVYAVYGPNAVFACPFMQGNADVLILRTAAGSPLTVVQVQRDGCGRVLVTHPGLTTYIAYLSTSSLLTQLDAITPTLTKATKNIPRIRVTPSINLRGGDPLLVQVVGASPGERFHVSECASAAAVNSAGCGEQPAAQPFIDTDPSGAGSIMFDARAMAATKPINMAALRLCTDQCVLMVAGTSADGTSEIVYAPLMFSK